MNIVTDFQSQMLGLLIWSPPQSEKLNLTCYRSMSNL